MIFWNQKAVGNYILTILNDDTVVASGDIDYFTTDAWQNATLLIPKLLDSLQSADNRQQYVVTRHHNSSTKY